MMSWKKTWNSVFF